MTDRLRPGLRGAAIVLAALAALPAAAAQAARAVHYDADDFFHAVEIDYSEGVQRMLAAGVDPNLRNARDQPALTEALQVHSLKVAQVLWAAPGIRVDERNGAGETPLMMAALKREEDAAKALLEHGAAAARSGWSPLHYAATGGDAGIVKMLLARGAPVDARSPNASTPLMMAAMYGSEDAVDALLAAGADRRARNELGLDAADFARKAGRDRLAQRLQPAAAP